MRHVIWSGSAGIRPVVIDANNIDHYPPTTAVKIILPSPSLTNLPSPTETPSDVQVDTLWVVAAAIALAVAAVLAAALLRLKRLRRN